MELDDFKRKKRFSNDVVADDDKSSTVRADNIIDLFRSYQKKHKRNVTFMIILDCALAAVYITNLFFQTGMEALGYFLMGAGLFGGAIYLFLKYKSFSPETYSLPIKEFLERAERKISYFKLTDYLIVVPLLLIIGFGGGLVFISGLLKYTDNFALLLIIWILFYISLCVFGFWAGRKNWEKEYGYILKTIIEMKIGYRIVDDNNNDNYLQEGP